MYEFRWIRLNKGCYCQFAIVCPSPCVDNTHKKILCVQSCYLQLGLSTASASNNTHGIWISSCLLLRSDALSPWPVVDTRPQTVKKTQRYVACELLQCTSVPHDVMFSLPVYGPSLCPIYMGNSSCSKHVMSSLTRTSSTGAISLGADIPKKIYWCVDLSNLSAKTSSGHFG